MPAYTNTLYIDQVVAFRKKMANESSLQKRNDLVDFLARLRDRASEQENTFARFGLLEVLHQTQVVELALDATANVCGFANVKGFYTLSPSPGEDIYARVVGELSYIDHIDQVLL